MYVATQRYKLIKQYFAHTSQNVKIFINNWVVKSQSIERFIILYPFKWTFHY